MLPEDFSALAHKLGKDAADQGLSQEQMGGAIVKFREQWADIVPAEWVEEFLIAIGEAYYRHRETVRLN